MGNDGLLTRLRRLQKYPPRGFGELRIVQRLNIKRRDACQRNQFSGKRRVVAVRVVQVFELNSAARTINGKRPRPLRSTPTFTICFGSSYRESSTSARTRLSFCAARSAA